MNKNQTSLTDEEKMKLDDDRRNTEEMISHIIETHRISLEKALKPYITHLANVKALRPEPIFIPQSLIPEHLSKDQIAQLVKEIK